MHFLDGVVEFFASHNSKVFVEKGAVQTFDKAIALRSSNFSGAMLDVLEGEEEFVRVSIGAAAELSTVVAEDGVNSRAMLFKTATPRC